MKTALPQIGWIGAGRMGVPMAGYILQAGYPLTVFSRNAASRAKLVAQGAREVTSTAANFQHTLISTRLEHFQ